MNLTNILTKYNIISYEELKLGWSSDKKYILTDNLNNKYMLRISDKSLYDKRNRQFRLLSEVSKLNINCPKPIEFGELENKIYLLLTYLEGKRAEEEIYNFNDIEQYNLGIEAGKILKIIHSYDKETDTLSWWDKYEPKSKRKIDTYLNSSLKHDNPEFLIDYYKENIHLMNNRPQILTHGDYHLGNMLIHNGHIVIIDFDKMNFADPYDEFKPYCWNVIRSEYFETGLINGYFDNKIPEDFFKILKFYTIESLISHLPWAMTFGDEEVKTAFELYDKVIEWYDNFKLEIPTWYKGVL